MSVSRAAQVRAAGGFGGPLIQDNAQPGQAFGARQAEAVEPAPLAEPAPEPLTDAVAEPERLGAIDLARGLAILGIFLVNMQFFAQPFGEMMSTPGPPEGSSTLDRIAYYFVMIFCAGKFYPLFSMLFGIGFMIQLDRATRAGRRFVPAYMRRLAVLCILGLAHGLLLWYGDVLFIYSIAGLILFGTVMLFRNITARGLLWTGIVLILVSAFMGLAVSALLGGSPPSDDTAVVAEGASGASGATTGPATLPATAPATLPTQPAKAAREGSITQQFFAELRNNTMRKGPADPIWIDYETRAYREGTYLDMFVFRGIAWLFMIVIGTLMAGFGAHVLGMFFIGAALFRGGLLYPGARLWHRRWALLGLVIGLPMVLVGVLLPEMADDDHSAYAIFGILNMFGGSLMSLGYLGAAALVVASGALPTIVGAMSRVGRMALTNYLSETILATYLMYSWGLGWFGSVLPAQQVLIVVSIYAVLLITSTIWLRFFQFGPMEWLWRSLTYFRGQPLLRRSAR
jgi:uncharacterized protein